MADTDKFNPWRNEYATNIDFNIVADNVEDAIRKAKEHLPTARIDYVHSLGHINIE